MRRTDRRILTFPAVQPCKEVSPLTLLTSLITICRDICSFRSKLFVTQRVNSREAIRQTEILLVLFEEIRERNLILSYSVIDCFVNLHFQFQKLQFLLEDCTREGARLFLLIKSSFIANEFCMIFRDFALALAFLPLDLIDITVEVKELVELVSKHSQTVEFKLEPEDGTTVDQLLSVLDQFEDRIEPSSTVIKAIFNHLNIKTWYACNMEVKFLNEEIGIESLSCDQKDYPLLSSLVGFMSYCRGVVFENLDYEKTEQRENNFSKEMIRCLNLNDLRCPISLELMTDPVTVSTGQTYDRSSIQKWLKAGNLICPTTTKKLTSTELVPNLTLQRIIQQFCSEYGISVSKSGNRSRDLSRTSVAGSEAYAGAMKFLSKFLSKKLRFGSVDEKNKAAFEIRLLSKSSIFNRTRLVKANTIPPLIDLLSSTNPFTQENAISALLKLSKEPTGRKVIIATGGLTPILELLKNGSRMEVRQIAAAIIFYLASVEEYRQLIGEIPETIPSLLGLVREGKLCGKTNSVLALFALALFPGNHGRILEAGTVPVLIDLLNPTDKEDLINDALAVLAKLATKAEGSVAILQASGIPIIMGYLRSLNSQTGKEYCVSILLSVCVNVGSEVIGVLAKDHLLMASLYSLLTEGTSPARNKARSLIKILHEFHEKSGYGLMSSTPLQERFVPVW